MGHYFRKQMSIALLATVLGVGTVPALGQSSEVTRFTDDLRYEGKGLSIWKNGKGAPGNPPAFLLGPTWDSGEKSIDSYFSLFGLGESGVGLHLNTYGRVGLKFRAYVDGGKLEFAYPAYLELEYPKYIPKNVRFNVKATFRPAYGRYFQTTSPAFGIDVYGVGKIYADARVKVKAAGDTIWNQTLVHIDTPAPEEKFLFNLEKVTSKIYNYADPLVNPLPVSFKFSEPDLSVFRQEKGTTPFSMASAKFSPYLSLDTNLTTFAASLIKPLKIFEYLLSGDYTIPETDYNVAWDICKVGGNVDFGFREDIEFLPDPLITLTATYPNGTTESHIIRNGEIAMFSMGSDNKPVTIRASTNLNPSLINKFSFGVGGAIGMSPIRLAAHGFYDAGLFNIGLPDFDFDPARIEWKPNPSTHRISEETFPLTGSYTADLQPISINQADLPLPVAVKPNYTNIPAFNGWTPGADDPNDFPLQVDAESNRSFYVTHPSTRIEARFGSIPIDQNSIRRDSDKRITVFLPWRQLAPGLYNFQVKTVSQGFETVNDIPLTVPYRKPRVESGLYRNAGDPSTPTRE